MQNTNNHRVSTFFQSFSQSSSATTQWISADGEHFWRINSIPSFYWREETHRVLSITQNMNWKILAKLNPFSFTMKISHELVKWVKSKCKILIQNNKHSLNYNTFLPLQRKGMVNREFFNIKESKKNQRVFNFISWKVSPFEIWLTFSINIDFSNSPYSKC